MFYLNYLKPKGIFFLFLFVFIFIYSGFKDCIANMFYFGFGNRYTDYKVFIDLPVYIIFNSISAYIGATLSKLISKEKEVN